MAQQDKGDGSGQSQHRPEHMKDVHPQASFIELRKQLESKT